MEITDFSKGQLWSILPGKFEILYEKFLEMQAEEFKSQIGDRGGDERPYRVTDGLAVIPITGPLTKRQSFFSFLFGGSSYAKIGQDLRMAVEDEEVGAIMLDIDSPGGTVSGAEGLADLVFASRSEKPILAFANGMMASAAYWVGSAADVVVAETTSMVGSIGVLMIHTDISEAEKKAGVKTTYLSAGSYKALGNSSQPLSDKAKDYFQSDLDYIYSIFVETVARNREVEVDAVLTSMADGKTFIGQQAKDVGLVDEIGGMEKALELASSMISDNQNIYGGIKMKTDENKIETVEKLTEAFPDLVMEAQDKAVEAQREKTRQEAKTEERDRIVELVKVQFGEEQSANLLKIIEEGVTPAQLEAIKAMNPEPEPEIEDEDDTKRAEMLKVIQDAGPENPGPDDDKTQAKDFMVMVKEYQVQNKCRYIDALMAVGRSHPEAHEEYIRRANA